MFTSRQDTYIEGDIKSIASRIYDQLYTTGSSLMDYEVERIVIDVCRDYLAWGGAFRAYELDGDDDTYSLMIDDTLNVYNDEMTIIRPVIMAKCDVMQSKRMEGAQNLGVQPAGISSSEAMQNYRDAIELMKKEAFNTHPFSVDSVSDIEGQVNKNNINSYGSIEINYNGWWK